MQVPELSVKPTSIEDLIRTSSSKGMIASTEIKMLGSQQRSEMIYLGTLSLIVLGIHGFSAGCVDVRLTDYDGHLLRQY